MLEIVGKEKTPDADGFARDMTKLHVETINKINAICEKYSANPFRAIKSFGSLIFQCGADLQAKFEAEHGDIFADSGENDDDEGGAT